MTRQNRTERAEQARSAFALSGAAARHRRTCRTLQRHRRLRRMRRDPALTRGGFHRAARLRARLVPRHPACASRAIVPLGRDDHAGPGAEPAYPPGGGRALGYWRTRWWPNTASISHCTAGRNRPARGHRPQPLDDGRYGGPARYRCATPSMRAPSVDAAARTRARKPAPYKRRRSSTIHIQAE